MARGDITQKITLDGDAEVRRKLDEIGRAGEKAFAGLGKGADGVARPLDGVRRSSAQVGFAVRNLSFQVNDLATSLASGAPVMQVFAQQGGQIVQAFQQGGGLSAVLGGITTALRNFITPARLAGAAAVTAAGGFAVLLAKAADTESSIKQFSAALKGLQQSQALRGGAGAQVVQVPLTAPAIAKTAQDLEQSARSLRDAGIGINDARTQLLAAIRTGVRPADAERAIRLGQELNAIFGEGTAEKFITAMGKGPEVFAEFAKGLGVTGAGFNNVDAILQAMERRFGGTAKTLVSPFRQAMRALGVAWQDFENTLADSPTVSLTFRTLAEDIDNLSRSIKQFDAGIISDVLKQFLGAGPKTETFGQEGAVGHADAFGIQQSINAMIANLPATMAQFRAAFVAELTTTRTQGETVFSQFSKWIGETLAVALRDQSIWEGFVSAAWAAIERVRGLLSALVDAALAAARAIAAAFSAAMQGKVVAETALPPGLIGDILGVPNLSGSGGFARGGLVRGPGTGTSDSVPAWLSNREFVNTARAVQFWGVDFFRSLNRLEIPKFAAGGMLSQSAAFAAPIVPRSRFGRMSAGTITAAARAASGGRAVHFHLGNDTVTLNAEPFGVEALVAAARRKNMLSAGRKPGWAGGRRYGG